METLLVYTAFYAFEAVCTVLDWVSPAKRLDASEHDRFADRAVYGRRHTTDPLA